MVTIVLNYREIKQNQERFSNIEPFISKYNWDRTKYPSKIEDWKKFESHNLTIALNVLCEKEMGICPAYTSKYNSTCEKQIILLMIPNKKKCSGIILE